MQKTLKFAVGAMALAAMITAFPAAATAAPTTKAQASDAAARGKTIRNGFAGRCLDADTNGGGRNGTIVQLWDCNAQDQRSLDIAVAGRVQNYAFPRCLQASGLANGSQVQLWDCGIVNNQLWLTPESGEWKVRGTNKCLEGDLNTIGRNGGRVQVWDCNGTQPQHWNAV